MGAGLSINLEVFLSFRGQRMWRGEDQLPVGTTVEALLSRLALGEPELAVLVNGRRAESHQVLQPGDQVAILRQVDGGD